MGSTSSEAPGATTTPPTIAPVERRANRLTKPSRKPLILARDLVARRRPHQPAALLGAPDAGRPAALEPPATGGEDLLEHLGGVGVLAGQHPVSRGDQGARDAGLEVAGRELRAGHAGTDDHQVLGCLVELV